MAKMPKPIYFFGACALAAAVFVIAQRATPSQPVAFEATAAAVIPTISPLEMMIRYDKPLPVENWDAS